MTYSTASLPSLRWLLAVPLTAAPTGRVVPLADALDVLAITAVVDLGPALGADGPRQAGVQFAKLRSFSRAAVIAATPLLANLHALADRIAASTRTPSATDVLAAVAKLVGQGPLHAEIAAIYAPKPAPARAPVPAEPSHAAAAGSLVDELLAQPTAPAAAPAVDRPAAILDAIVRAGQPPPPSATDVDLTRAARERIASAAARAADIVLAEPTVRAREALWRDLKLVHEQCANRQGFSASVLDADPAIVARYLAQLAEDDPMARPDVLFLAGAVTDPGNLTEIAEQAADALVPVVVSLPAATLGRASLAELVDIPPADIPPAWTDLRADPNSRWLAAVTNPVVHVRDGQRTIHGDPALTLAAMIAASHRDTGGLASLARAGAFRAPLVADGGPHGDDVPPPTEQLALLKTQGRLAALGVIALGSPRTGESIVVAACPVIHAAEDTGSLPAQILTGRIVRFALWVRAQIPPGTPAPAVQKLFFDAATVSLLPGLTRDEAAMTADVDIPNHQVVITARVHPAIAGSPLEINFALPLSNLG